jgi:hydrogenase expression/formation protein HypD
MASAADIERDAGNWLKKLHALDLQEPVRIMNVCGGHERAISIAGLRSAIPKKIELVPGPGCPVCICPEEDIYEAMQLALHEDVILAAFGDMLRVPVNVPKKEPRSLEQARAAGADIRPVASPTEVCASQEQIESTRIFSRPGSKPRRRRSPRCWRRACRPTCSCCFQED